MASNKFRQAYRTLTRSEALAMNDIKDKALELDNLFEALPSSREKSLAMTKLEEAVMWAVKGMTA